MTLFIADIASYQAGLTLSKIRPDCVGVFAKATQGTGYVDPYYAGWRDQAAKAGLLFAAYHYITMDDAVAQVANIVANIGDKKVPLMFDVEKGSGDLNQTLALIQAAKSAGLNPRLLYLPMWYWEQEGRPDLSGLARMGVSLIASSYPSSRSGSPSTLYPGDSAAGWGAYGGAAPALYQFTDAAIEGGQQVDMNAFRGSMEQLGSVLGLTTQPVAPAPPFPGRTLTWNPASTTEMHGSDVHEWQQKMHDRGWAITVDGWYGPQSVSFCVAFQRDSTAHGWPLKEDGAVGPLTWKATFERPVS